MAELRTWMETLTGMEDYSDKKFTSFVENINDKFIDKLIHNLEERFQDSEILELFQAFRPGTEDEEPIQPFNDDLETLCQHFDVDFQQAETEMIHMREVAPRTTQRA
ncbi:uncharacterized protein LOC121408121 [Lytechinus variegatus]|uniref:uncharacterized protein LOC121408121 n=1 Tax=Lytechinus variegatus TaxID=7654 RepID=UPI001BB2601D|nr:uncharacterized protein LOC121408121 [Lytechinus variegatus]